MRAVAVAALLLPALALPGAASSRRVEVRDPNPCLGGGTPDLLCPTLTISRPRDMYFERRHGRARLRATSSLNSVGLGPIELHGRRTGPNTMSATQRIYRRSGGYVTVRTGAHLGFKSIPGQYRYWKLRDAARFELWSVDSEGRSVRRVRTGPKVYYCLRDLKRTHPRPRSPRRFHYPSCSQNPGARRLTLGTSVGWSDIYPAHYHEQWIDVTGLHGRFRYVLIADPEGAIYTTSPRAARSSRLVRIP
jgi:hypothetical protein